MIGGGEASNCWFIVNYCFSLKFQYSVLNFSLIFNMCLPYWFVAFFLKYF